MNHTGCLSEIQGSKHLNQHYMNAILPLAIEKKTANDASEDIVDFPNTLQDISSENLKQLIRASPGDISEIGGWLLLAGRNLITNFRKITFEQRELKNFVSRKTI